MSKESIGFDNVLLHLRESNFTQTTTQQGKLFEKLTKRILQLSPLFNTRFKEVYLWSEFSDRFHIHSQDIGIDLMALDFSGQWASIQCKNFDSTHKIDVGDLKNFLGINSIYKADKSLFCVISHKLIFHTCKNVSENFYKAIIQANTQECEVKSYGYDDLAHNVGIDWERFEGKSAKEGDFKSLLLKGKKSLREHQNAAHKAVLAHFLEKHNPRGKVIMACGTGKSLLGIRLIDSMLKNGEIALFLAPSLALIKPLNQI